MTTQPSSQSVAAAAPCPGCGAQMVFNPRLGQVACPYCHQDVAVPQSAHPLVEQDFEQWVNRDTALTALSQQALEVECPGCRAQITFEPPEVAGNCPFCSTHITTQPHAAAPTITPGGILPFKIEQKKARRQLSEWLKSRWFAPNSLKQLAQHERMQGVYLPYWTFDCQTETRYTGQRGTYYYVTRQRQVKNDAGKLVTETYEERKTRWRDQSGQVERRFDDCLVRAMKSINTEHLDQLEPWGLQHLVAYDPQYLTGFRVQRYQVDLKEGFNQARQEMKARIKSDIEQDIGGDDQRIDSRSTDYQNKSFKHLLLPVWIATYRYRNQPYQVMVNGETGEVIGDRPYSVFKIVLATGAVLALTTFILLVILIIFAFATEEAPVVEPQVSLTIHAEASRDF